MKGCHGLAGDLVLEPHQRAPGVLGRADGIGLAEGVVEDLQRQRPGVAGRLDVVDEADEVEVALPREESVVPAPAERVHRQLRGVRELDEEDLVARDVADGVRGVTAGQDVEAVEARPHGEVVGELGDAPRTSVVVDVASPGQGLERHPHVVRRRELAQPPAPSSRMDTSKAVPGCSTMPIGVTCTTPLTRGSHWARSPVDVRRPGASPPSRATRSAAADSTRSWTTTSSKPTSISAHAVARPAPPAPTCRTGPVRSPSRKSSSPARKPA